MKGSVATQRSSVNEKAEKRRNLHRGNAAKGRRKKQLLRSTPPATSRRRGRPTTLKAVKSQRKAVERQWKVKERQCRTDEEVVRVPLAQGFMDLLDASVPDCSDTMFTTVGWLVRCY